MDTRSGRASGARASVGSLNVRALAGWVRIGDGEFYHRTGLSEVGLLVLNCDIALSPEDVETLSRANRAAQGGGNVCFGAGETPALDIPQGWRSARTDYNAKATSLAAAITLKRLWEPLCAEVGAEPLFNGQVRNNGPAADLVPHLDQRTSLARLLWKLGLFILHCIIMQGQWRGVHVTIVISEGNLAAPLCLTRGATCYEDGIGGAPCMISLPIGPCGAPMLMQCVHSALCCPTDARRCRHSRARP
mmetsp:Transcript_9046/g.21132  ORF Transcript_9046/g.21132 Transcript_9046/m.21132 type:complete len:247 (-) Transcript_9046:408-1148(-)